MRKYLFIAWMFCCILMGPASTNAAVINFDDLGVIDTEDYIVVTDRYTGVTFSNAAALTSYLTLNEFEFPAHSGDNIAFDHEGPMTIRFAVSMGDVGAYFTYASALVLNFYDATDALIGTVSSAFSSNMGLSGDAGSQPNEYLHFSSSGGISKVVVTGAPAGSSFAMDDLTFTHCAAAIPEPSSVMLMVLSLAGLWGFRRNATD